MKLFAIATLALSLSAGAASAAFLDNHNDYFAASASGGAISSSAFVGKDWTGIKAMPRISKPMRTASDWCQKVITLPYNYSVADRSFCSGQSNGDNY
jgi:hypothetical protein